jgi:hypothetical protein
MTLINNWLNAYDKGSTQNETIYYPYTGKEIAELLGTEEKKGKYSEIKAYEAQSEV